MELTDLAYIDENGYFFADYPTFLAYYQEKYRGIYGADVYLEADSQDGQNLAIQAKGAYDTAALGAATYNSFSPSTAQGVGLARVVKINGIKKRVATHSTVDVDIVGTATTTIINGVVQDTLNQKWDLPASVIIPGGGSITVTATAQLEGAISAAAHAVNKIFTPTRGWQTVDNPLAATLGVAVETDPALRIRQAESTANPSLTVLEGTEGAVANVAGVTAVRAYENDTGSTDSNTLPAHSFSIVAEGGDSTEVAQAIQIHKTPGTETYGTTTVVVYDKKGMPISIHFYRPTQVTITATVTISASDEYSDDYDDMIAAAIADAINSGAASEKGNRIGGTVLITKLYAPTYLPGAPGQTYDVVSLEIGKNAAPQAGINIPIAFNEIPVCVAADDITVVVT